MYYDEWSAKELLSESVDRFAIDGDEEVGGFMTAWDERQVRVVQHIEGSGVGRDRYPYISHFGLQYLLVKRLGSWGVSALSLLSGLGMICVIAGLAAFSEREFGRLSGIAIVVAFSFSPLMVIHSLNPYWMIFLSFLPFMAVLILYPRARTTVQFAGICSLAGLLIFLKALTGYEYLSAIALGAALPVIYYEWSTATRNDLALARRIVRRGFAIGVSSVLGFLLAASLHIAKAAAFFGSFSKGFAAFVTPINYSTYDSPAGLREDIVVDIPSVLGAAMDTFLKYNFPITMLLYSLLFASTIVLINRSGRSPRRWWSSAGRKYQALFITWLFSIIGSVSWVFLAARHSIPHAFINWILAYMFMNVFAALLLGRNLALLQASPELMRAQVGDVARPGE